MSSPIGWKEFVATALEHHASLRDVSFRFPTLRKRLEASTSDGFVGSDESILNFSATNAVDLELADHAQLSGHKGLIVCRPDHSASSVVSAIGSALNKQLLGAVAESRRNPMLWKPGSYFTVWGGLFRFIGVEHSDILGQDVIKYEYRAGTAQCYLSFISSDATLADGITEMPAKSLSKVAIPKLRHTLDDKATEPESPSAWENQFGADSSICYVSSPSTSYGSVPPSALPQTLVTKGAFTEPLVEVTALSRLTGGQHGIPQVRTNKGVWMKSDECDIIPWVVAVGRWQGDTGYEGDLLAVREMIDEGRKISRVFIDISSPDQIGQDELTDIINAGIPVVVYCDSDSLPGLGWLRDEGLALQVWDHESLKECAHTAKKANFPLALHESKRLNRGISLIPYEESNLDYRDVVFLERLSEASKFIRELGDEAEDFDDDHRDAIRNLQWIISKILKKTEAFGEEQSEIQSDSINRCFDELEDGSWLSAEQRSLAAEARKDLLSLVSPDIVPPKQRFSHDRIVASMEAGQRVCVITPDPNERALKRSYWDGYFERHGIRRDNFSVLTPNELIKRGPRTGVEVAIVTGWYRRQTMRLLLESGACDEYDLILYKSTEASGGELEVRWYLDARQYWEQGENKLIKDSRKSMSGMHLGDLPKVPKPRFQRAPSKGVDSDRSASGLIEDLERMNFGEDRRHPRNDSECLARRMQMSDGSCRWVQVGESADKEQGETIPVVTGLVEGSVDHVMRLKGWRIQPGDMVLIEKADISAKVATFSEKRLAELASRWRKPIDDNLPTLGASKIVELIQQEGCSRSRATILKWINGGTDVAPRSTSDWIAIARAFGVEYTQRELAEIRGAVRVLRGKRINAGLVTSREIERAFALDVIDLGLDDAVARFDEHGLGSVEVVVVDDIGPATIVDRGRTGFYTWSDRT